MVMVTRLGQIVELLRLTQRNFSDEELQSVAWKCRLQKYSPEFIIELLKRLPVQCIKQTIEEYKNSATEGAQTDTLDNKTFLLSRDAFASVKIRAVQSFLSWCGEHDGPLTLKHKHLLGCGKIPYGWFIGYVQAHPQLQKACHMQNGQLCVR